MFNVRPADIPEGQNLGRVRTGRFQGFVEPLLLPDDESKM